MLNLEEMTEFVPVILTVDSVEVDPELVTLSVVAVAVAILVVPEVLT